MREKNEGKAEEESGTLKPGYDSPLPGWAACTLEDSRAYLLIPIMRRQTWA
ncbi:MAG TPA: hypothetical protein VKZ54_04045 [Membranihabitans sp.]|nr:hypothetical protein [Membranihabitans sp.]